MKYLYQTSKTLAQPIMYFKNVYYWRRKQNLKNKQVKTAMAVTIPFTFVSM